MIENLFRPFILARLIAGLTAAALVGVGAVVAIEVLRRFRPESHAEAQIALEHRAELVATAVQGALFATFAGLFLTVAGADRAAHEIRGAMCAYGVLGSTPSGFHALFASVIAALGCALWVVVHRLDLRLSSLQLTRTKFALALALAPLVFVDLLLTTRYLLDLDFSVVASCCSVTLDGLGPEGASSALGSALAPFGATLGVLAVAASACAFAAHRPGRFGATIAGLFSIAALAVGASSVVHHVAPHVYGVPTHLCPFCLLHLDVGGIGWPLFGALFLGTALGLGLPVVEALRDRSDEDAEVNALSRRVGLLASLAWLAVAALAIYPVLHYRLVSGATLF
jgi:hypothetical protein